MHNCWIISVNPKTWWRRGNGSLSKINCISVICKVSTKSGNKGHTYFLFLAGVHISMEHVPCIFQPPDTCSGKVPLHLKQRVQLLLCRKHNKYTSLPCILATLLLCGCVCVCVFVQIDSWLQCFKIRVLLPLKLCISKNVSSVVLKNVMYYFKTLETM